PDRRGAKRTRVERRLRQSARHRVGQPMLADEETGKPASRLASLVLSIAYLVVAFEAGGVEGALRMLLFCLVPVAYIWFPDVLGDYTGTVRRADRRRVRLDVLRTRSQSLPVRDLDVLDRRARARIAGVVAAGGHRSTDRARIDSRLVRWISAD